MSTDLIRKGEIAWRAPSNLAIIKYWGKHGRQLPRNASISLTLSTANTAMEIAWQIQDESKGLTIDFLFEGLKKPDFAAKINKFLLSIQDEFTFLKGIHLSIESSNSFPHSSGIASSASSMAALALCLCSIEQELTDGSLNETDFYKKASHIARLGSGSASRSLYPDLASWGGHKDIDDSSNEYASPFVEAADVFKTMHDDILIVSSKVKSVSSTAGHQLMEGNPYSDSRYQQANDRLSKLLIALKAGDVMTFGKIAEDEALTLHGMMMCSDPSYILMEPNTIEMINRIRTYRDETGVPVYFSLDAGPNIHLLYPHEVAPMVDLFIQEELRELCVEGRIIRDQVGNGPERM